MYQCKITKVVTLMPFMVICSSALQSVVPPDLEGDDAKSGGWELLDRRDQVLLMLATEIETNITAGRKFYEIPTRVTEAYKQTGNQTKYHLIYVVMESNCPMEKPYNDKVCRPNLRYRRRRICSATILETPPKNQHEVSQYECDALWID
ncbi:uncharacterized protein LOC144133966 [Amblyomma americanum]